MRIINNWKKKESEYTTRRPLTDEQKKAIREKIAKKVAKEKVTKEKLLAKENVFEIAEEVVVPLEDKNLVLEAGDIVEIIPANSKKTEADDKKDDSEDDEEEDDEEKKDKEKESK